MTDTGPRQDSSFSASLKRIAIGTVISLAAGGLGCVIGATVGGNLAGPIEFMGRHGYEAAGLIGFWVGFLASASITPAVLSYRNRKPHE